jgi:hypothetical protein
MIGVAIFWWLLTIFFGVAITKVKGDGEIIVALFFWVVFWGAVTATTSALLGVSV